MAQETADQILADLLGIEVCSDKSRSISNTDAVDPFDRQHLLAGALPINGRHTKSGVVLDIVRHFRDGGGLHAQVRLDGHRTVERAHHLGRLQPAQRRVPVFGKPGPVVEAAHVGGKARLDAGPQHFDGDLTARPVRIDHRTLVDLRHRGGRDRRPDLGENLVHRLAEGRCDDGAGRLERERRHTILQAFQLACQLSAHQIWAGRQELACLDIGRA